MTTLSILHFNDVYRVRPQKQGTSPETIDVTQFAALLDTLRSEPAYETHGLTLFSGDLFSPSVESSVTRGSHMVSRLLSLAKGYRFNPHSKVPVINYLAPDVALTGNHDFDFGYPHLSQLVQDCKFPWLLSNVTDTNTGRVPEFLEEFRVLEKAGVRIGVIGLVERDWISTVPTWPQNFQWQDMTDVGLQLSEKLRDPNGDHKCDIIIALTHSRVPNDIALAKSLSAVAGKDVSQQHGVDLILGGHDHLYFVSRGVQHWDGYDTEQPVLGAEGDDGVFVVKSGTDFRDLSEINLEIETSQPGCIRTKTVKAIAGKRHVITPTMPSSTKLSDILKDLLSSVSSALGVPVCRTSVPLDLRSQHIRLEESASGNWFADILLHTYDEALCVKSGGGAHGVIICAGALRGDSVYGPGEISMGDVMEILPFEDAIVVLELSGQAVWDALENGLSSWPSQEGRFPVISGLRVEWDSRKPPYKRINKIMVESKPGTSSQQEELSLSALYRIVTRDYMAQGHDGFDALKDQTCLIDHETGILMSAIVRRFLLGSQFIHHLQQMSSEDSPTEYLSPRTSEIISRARQSPIVTKWKDVAKHVLADAHHEDTQDALHVATREHMSEVDCYDGKAARANEIGQSSPVDWKEKELITVNPTVDGRLRNVARPAN